MQHVTLGRTTAQVSELCLGTMYFGTTVPVPDSERLLDRFMDAGGNFIDTANIYCTWRNGGVGGESETLLGSWMKARGNRAQVFVATKSGFPMPDGDGLSAAQVVLQVENSLRRLQTDTIDLYYAHRDDPITPLEETLEACHRLVQAGKVRFIAASNYRPWRLEKALCLSRLHGWEEFQAIQQRHTYLRPLPGAKFAGGFQIVLDNDLIALCREEQITPLAYSALLGGAYTRPERSSGFEGYLSLENEQRVARLKQVAAELHISANTLILAWMMHADPRIIPVMSASSGEQLEENLAACAVALTAEQMAALDEGLPD